MYGYVASPLRHPRLEELVLGFFRPFRGFFRRRFVLLQVRDGDEGVPEAVDAEHDLADVLRGEEEGARFHCVATVVRLLWWIMGLNMWCTLYFYLAGCSQLRASAREAGLSAKVFAFPLPDAK